MSFLRKPSLLLLTIAFMLMFVPISQAQAQVSDVELIKLRERVLSWAYQYVCEDITPTKFPNECPGKPDGKSNGGTGVGDSILFSSILYNSGETWASRNIIESKDEQGGMWRSPQRRRDRTDGSWGSKRFSPDHMLGVLLYLVTEYNRGNPETARAFANHWGSWMANHLSQGEFSLCRWDYNPAPIEGGESGLTAMDHCALEGKVLGGREAIIRRVFDYVGANSPTRKVGFFGQRRLGDGEDVGKLFADLNTRCFGSRTVGGKFNCHLASVASLILQEMGEDHRLIAIDEGFQQNPFVLWVQNGRQQNETIRQLTYDRCSEADASHQADPTRPHTQWTWERSEFDGDRPVWKKSFGWDCVAMLNLITNSSRELYDPYPGFSSNLVLDSVFYLDRYTDLNNAFGSQNYQVATKHWLQSGINEGRDSSPVFSVSFYLARYPGLQQAFGNQNYQAATKHWLQSGINEGRDSSPAFSVAFYLSKYPDLQQAFGPQNYQAAIQHWLRVGVNEGRDSSPAFSVAFYLSKYPDLQQAFAPQNYRSAIQHWLQFGIDEGRQGSADFDPVYYLSNNPDVAAAYGANNYKGAIQHWLLYGRQEGRRGVP